MSRGKGFFDKYSVTRNDGKPLKGGCVVLEWGDPNARAGIAAFSGKVRSEHYHALADDLDNLILAWNKAAPPECDRYSPALKSSMDMHMADYPVMNPDSLGLWANIPTFVEPLQAQLTAANEENARLERELGECLGWIHNTKNHAPYEAAGATWQTRHDEDQRKIARLREALGKANEVLANLGYEDRGFCQRCGVFTADGDEGIGLWEVDGEIVCDDCKAAKALMGGE